MHFNIILPSPPRSFPLRICYKKCINLSPTL